MEPSGDEINIKIDNGTQRIGDGICAAPTLRICIGVYAHSGNVVNIEQAKALLTTNAAPPPRTGIGVFTAKIRIIPPTTAGMSNALPMAGSAGAGVYPFSLVDKKRDFAADSPDNPDLGLDPSGRYAFASDNRIGVPDNPCKRCLHHLTFAVSSG